MNLRKRSVHPYKIPRLRTLDLFTQKKLSPLEEKIVVETVRTILRYPIGQYRSVAHTEKVLSLIGPLVAKNVLAPIHLTPEQRRFLLKELSFAFNENVSVDLSHIKEHAQEIDKLFDKRALTNIKNDITNSLGPAISAIAFEMRPRYNDLESFKKVVDFQIRHDIFHAIAIIQQELNQMSRHCKK